MKTLYTVDREHYDKHYQLNGDEGNPVSSKITQLEREAHVGTPARRSFYRQVAKSYTPRHQFATEYDSITLPGLTISPLNRDFWPTWYCKEVWHVQDGLYIGGVNRPIVTARTTKSVQVSLYIGPFPNKVAAAYQKARQCFPEDSLTVVSRHKEFFYNATVEVVRPPSKASPLLIAVPHTGSTIHATYLIAAWGLEYELPKSLGGLL